MVFPPLLALPEAGVKICQVDGTIHTRMFYICICTPTLVHENPRSMLRFRCASVACRLPVTQIQGCDAILARMQEMLLGFQADLGGISDEIKHLQVCTDTHTELVGRGEYVSSRVKKLCCRIFCLCPLWPYLYSQSSLAAFRTES